MQHIELSDTLYAEAEKRAQSAGFGSVDAYIAEVLQEDFSAPESFEYLFTPERLAHVDRANNEIASGEFSTPEQVDRHIAEIRAACLRENPS